MTHKHYKGFTIIELLVVVGIIVILISLLIPVIGSVTEQSRKTVCQSNIRQITNAFLMYSQSNKDYFPSVAPYRQNTQNPCPYDWIYWQKNRNIDDSPILKYISSKNVFICPSDDVSSHYNVSFNPIDGAYMYSYVINEYLGFYGYNSYRLPPKISQIKSPSLTITIVDRR